MTATLIPPKPKAPPGPPEREPFLGLRIRLWLGCVAGGAVAGLGAMWVLGTRGAAAAGTGELHAWLAGVAFAAVGAGMLMAFWLDHHVVGHLRGLLRGLNSGRVAELRGLPSAAGWGELSELGAVAQDLLVRQRQSATASQELEQSRVQLAALQGALDRWLRTEVWEPPAVGPGPLTETVDALARGFARRAGVDEQNAQVARQVAEDLAAALADSQESAEQAERGFVEVTAMLTTVRELQRLSGDLQAALAAIGTPAEADAPAPAGESTRAALEELVDASRASVEAIGAGMLRVQEVSALVQRLANRATLVAIHAVTAGRHEGSAADFAEAMKDLVRDVREATDRTGQLVTEIEASVAEASERMRGAREHALGRLGEEAPAPAAPPAGRALDDAQRLLERVREMVQDAASKGVRLSAAGERASRAAERLARRVAEQTSDARALLVRMAASGAGVPRDETRAEARDEMRGEMRDEMPTPLSRELRLLDEGETGTSPGAAAERLREDRP